MYQVIIQDILKFYFIYIGKGFRYAIIAFIITFLSCGWFYKNYKKKSFVNFEIIFRSVVMSLMIIYLYIVIGITLLSRNKQFDMFVNLQLFSTFDRTLAAQKYICENILMLIPFAILLYMLATPFRKIGFSLLAGFFFSLAIEITQLVTGLGHFILDDLLANTIGMLIGYIMCKIATLAWKLFFLIKNEIQRIISKK